MMNTIVMYFGTFILVECYMNLINNEHSEHVLWINDLPFHNQLCTWYWKFTSRSAREHSSMNNTWDIGQSMNMFSWDHLYQTFHQL